MKVRVLNTANPYNEESTDDILEVVGINWLINRKQVNFLCIDPERDTGTLAVASQKCEIIDNNINFKSIYYNNNPDLKSIYHWALIENKWLDDFLENDPDIHMKFRMILRMEHIID